MTLEIVRNTFAAGRELHVGEVVTDLSDMIARDLIAARKAVSVRRSPVAAPVATEAADLAREPMTKPRRKKGESS